MRCQNSLRGQPQIRNNEFIDEWLRMESYSHVNNSLTHSLLRICYNLYMGRKKKEDKNTDFGLRKLKDETVSWIFAVSFFVLFIIFILAPLGMAGSVGNKVYNILKYYLVLDIFYYPCYLFFFLFHSPNQ